MLCVIGGSCSGRRALVAQRFPHALWHHLESSAPPNLWATRLAPGGLRVVTGWVGWLEAELAMTADDEAVKAAWREHLVALGEWERESGGEVLLILDEMGAGIVPMAAEARRLRDLNGWFNQAVVARSRTVWQVRHGLCKQLK